MAAALYQSSTCLHAQKAPRGTSLTSGPLAQQIVQTGVAVIRRDLPGNPAVTIPLALDH